MQRIGAGFHEKRRRFAAGRRIYRGTWPPAPKLLRMDATTALHQRRPGPGATTRQSGLNRQDRCLAWAWVSTPVDFQAVLPAAQFCERVHSRFRRAVALACRRR